MNKSLIEIEKCNCEQSLALEKELFETEKINQDLIERMKSIIIVLELCSVELRVIHDQTQVENFVHGHLDTLIAKVRTKKRES